MTEFEVIWSNSARRQLKKLERSVAKRVLDATEQLRVDPFRSARKLTGAPYYRVRVGDYRIIIDIEGAILRVLVLKVGHRKSIY